jgi:hypothetical protein
MSGVRDRLRGKWRITETGTWDNDYLAHLIHEGSGSEVASVA